MKLKEKLSSGKHKNLYYKTLIRKNCIKNENFIKK